jgi:hypothetical protein
VATVTQDFAKQCLERFGVKMSQKAEIKEEKSPFTSDIVSKQSSHEGKLKATDDIKTLQVSHLR